MATLRPLATMSARVVASRSAVRIRPTATTASVMSAGGSSRRARRLQKRRKREPSGRDDLVEDQRADQHARQGEEQRHAEVPTAHLVGAEMERHDGGDRQPADAVEPGLVRHAVRPGEPGERRRGIHRRRVCHCGQMTSASSSYTDAANVDVGDLGQLRQLLGEQADFVVGVDLRLQQLEVRDAVRFAVGIGLAEQFGVGLPAERLALERTGSSGCRRPRRGRTPTGRRPRGRRAHRRGHASWPARSPGPRSAARRGTGGSCRSRRTIPERRSRRGRTGRSRCRHGRASPARCSCSRGSRRSRRWRCGRAGRIRRAARCRSPRPRRVLPRRASPPPPA